MTIEGEGYIRAQHSAAKVVEIRADKQHKVMLLEEKYKNLGAGGALAQSLIDTSFALCNS